MLHIFQSFLNVDGWCLVRIWRLTKRFKVPALAAFWLSHDQRSPTELIYSEYKTSGFESKKKNINKNLYIDSFLNNKGTCFLPRVSFRGPPWCDWVAWIHDMTRWQSKDPTASVSTDLVDSKPIGCNVSFACKQHNSGVAPSQLTVAT